MKTLLRFELKKIIGRRINIVAMILGLFVLILSNVITIVNASVSSSDGDNTSVILNLKSYAETESSR